MSDAYLPCEACEGDGRARPNEHGAYVAGDPENCSRCGGKGTSHDLACPLCSQRTPDHLMCECDDTVCSDCHQKRHDDTCEDCDGRGSINITRRARAKYGAYIPSEAIGPNGYEISATCGSCEGSGRTTA